MNHTTSNSVQTWVTKTDSHHSMYPDLFTGSHSANNGKTYEWMLHHRAVYWDDCTSVFISHITWYSWRAACYKVQDREFASGNQRRSSNLYFQTLHVKPWRSSFYEQVLSINISRILPIWYIGNITISGQYACLCIDQALLETLCTAASLVQSSFSWLDSCLQIY